MQVAPDALRSARRAVIRVRVLVVGGTGFIGSRVVARLCALGHAVAVFHRGETRITVPAGCTEFLGDERDLPSFRDRFEAYAPEVVIDMILGTEAEARRFVTACRGVARRAVVISSMDVYRAYDRYRRRDPGPPDPVPLREDGPLRDRLHPYLATEAVPTADDYDKILVERTVSGERALPCTVLRLPMVYGPGDPLHRFHGWLQRMRDGRPAILVDAERAAWRGSMGFLDDVAAAIALAASAPRAAGRTYNVGEPLALTQQEWIGSLGAVVGWTGTVVVAPPERMPPHLVLDRDFRQDWVVDTTRIRGDLGFAEPTSPLDALRTAAAWELAHPPEGLEADYPAEDRVLQSLSASPG